MTVKSVLYLPDFGNFVMKSHRHSLEWQSVFWCDGKHGGFSWICVCLVRLTGRTPLDILFDILFHVWPPEVSFFQFVCV
jgi:hypothetical protein